MAQRILQHRWPNEYLHGVRLFMSAAVFNIVDKLEAGAELERIALFRGPVVQAPEVSTGVFVSDDKTHTATYELRSNHLSRPEEQWPAGKP